MIEDQKALSGVIVADFSRVLAGPLATMNLGDLGADVIKVERTGVGDDTRAWGPPFVEEGSTYYLSLNRNKRSIELDLKDPDDIEVARELVKRADVLIENFKPGAMSRLGIGYEEAAELNPGIIYCSISAFGSDPEAAKLPGYDFLVQAASGLMSITGEEDGTPLKVGVALVDVICGLNATIGILAALEARRHTGHGQLIETSLMSSALGALVNQASSYLLADVVPQKLGNRHPSIAPYETYHAADRPFAVAAGNHTLWERLCEALDLTELLDDERFATNAARIAHIDELGEILNNVFATEPADTWIEGLRAAGVPAGRINGIDEAFELAQRLGLNPIVEAPGSQTGAPLQLVSSPLKMSSTPPKVESGPPKLGEHSEEIRAWLQKGAQ